MAEESLLPSADDAGTGSDQQDAPANVDNQPAKGSTWNWNDEVPGIGEAPDWFKADKYSSVAEQAKAYGALESKLGAFTGAPETYEVPAAEHFAKDIDLPEGIELDLDPNDPLLQAFMPAAKEMGINQEGFNRLVGLYVKQQAADYAATMQTADNEKKLLGENADARLQNVARWGKANLDESLYGKLEETLTSAAAVEVIEQLIAKTRNAPVPNANAAEAVPGITKKDYDIEMGKKNDKGELLYIVDPEHRQKVERMGKRLFGTEPNRQVVG